MYFLASEYEEGGNAFCIMGYVARAMKENGMSNEEISAYRKDAMSADYQHLRDVSQEIIDKLNAMEDEDNDNPFDDMDKKEIYESIMANVAKEVKKALKNLV